MIPKSSTKTTSDLVFLSGTSLDSTQPSGLCGARLPASGPSLPGLHIDRECSARRLTASEMQQASASPSLAIRICGDDVRLPVLSNLPGKTYPLWRPGLDRWYRTRPPLAFRSEGPSGRRPLLFSMGCMFLPERFGFPLTTSTCNYAEAMRGGHRDHKLRLLPAYRLARKGQPPADPSPASISPCDS